MNLNLNLSKILKCLYLPDYWFFSSYITLIINNQSILIIYITQQAIIKQFLLQFINCIISTRHKLNVDKNSRKKEKHDKNTSNLINI